MRPIFIVMLICLSSLTDGNAFRMAAKEEATEEGKKKKGGVFVPEDWPWEQAKKLFEKPDVLPADEVEVR